MKLSFRFLWTLFLWTLRGGLFGANTTVVLSFAPVVSLRHVRSNDDRPNFHDDVQIASTARVGNQQWHLISRCSPAMAVGGSSAQWESDMNDSDTLEQNNIPTTTIDKKAILQSPKTIAMPTPKRTWQVWKTISKLEEILSSKNEIEQALYPAPRELVIKVVSILKRLATQHEGKIEWQGLLNKSTLLHEVEESILAIHFLQEEWATDSKANEVVLVDVCCGKGVFSLLASYYFANNKTSTKIATTSTTTEAGISIQKIIMLDKDPKLRWDHIDASNNQDGNGHGRPLIECWPRFNLHETDEVVRRLEAETAPLALVGIHLCKTLSPACIGIANILGPEKCPHLILAPCCLPRVVVQSKYNNKKKNNNSKSKFLEVRQYETQDQRQARRLAQERRARAMVRGNRRNDDNDNNIVCWKCGEFGHTKADCPSNQLTGKPSLIKPPTMALEVSGILETPRPFGSYCTLLSTSIQRSTITVEETGLTNNHMSSKKKSSSKQEANNWNRDRKSMYIVASERHAPHLT